MWSKISWSRKTNILWFHLFELCELIRLRELEGRVVLPEAGERVNGEVVEWNRDSFCKMKKSYRSVTEQCEYT